MDVYADRRHHTAYVERQHVVGQLRTSNVTAIRASGSSPTSVP